MYGGDNIAIDSNLDIGDFTANDFGESNFDSVEIFENLVWGEGYIRPIPQIRVGNLQKFAVDNPSAKISYA